jgi:hypothetical protein
LIDSRQKLEIENVALKEIRVDEMPCELLSGKSK